MTAPPGFLGFSERLAGSGIADVVIFGYRPRQHLSRQKQ